MRLRIKKTHLAFFLILITIFNLVCFFVVHSLGQLQTTIYLTKDGFSPSKVTIQEGTLIIFVNSDSVAHWPASNVHPSHDVYPEFDPKIQIDPQKQWVFIPKQGAWKFHDHLFPHFRGELVVTKASLLTKLLLLLPLKKETSSTLPVEMTKAQQKQTTKEYNTIRAVADQEGVEKALQLLANELDVTMAFCGHTDLNNIDKNILLNPNALKI